jgi:hypothetical protein
MKADMKSPHAKIHTAGSLSFQNLVGNQDRIQKRKTYSGQFFLL